MLTIAIAPLSYGPVQFRISEILKIFVLFNPLTAIGIGIGTFFSNLASPYFGPWELIWMPLTDTFGGFLVWLIFLLLHKRLPIIPMLIYSLTTGLAVGCMLYFLGIGGFWLLTASVALSEMVILIGGIPIIFGIVKILRARNFTFFDD